jgi:hypothetical protein
MTQTVIVYYTVIVLLSTPSPIILKISIALKVLIVFQPHVCLFHAPKPYITACISGTCSEIGLLLLADSENTKRRSAVWPVRFYEIVIGFYRPNGI